jgi:hypothetical protein
MQVNPPSGQQEWPWPDSLDALTAAPDYHRVILENERVRVLDTSIRAGERTPVHTHRWPAVLYVLSWSDFIRYDDKGNVLLDSREVDALKAAPTVLWSAPLPPHSLLNIGAADMHIISVELKESVG